MCVVAIPESSGDTYLEPETPRHPYFWSHAGNLRALKVANGEKTGNYGVLPMIEIKIWRRRGSNPGPKMVRRSHLHAYFVF